jgi:hypothetical protein
MTKRLLPIWEKFEQESLASAPAMQRQEMQKMFYWGASTLLSVLQAIPHETSEEERAVIFEETYQECRDYMRTAAEDYRQRSKSFRQESDRNADPGSPYAVEHGCLCPRKNPVNGLKGKDGGPIFELAKNCPMHGLESDRPC